MMGLHVETGQLTPAPDPVQPYDPGESPATAPPTAVTGQLSGPTVPARDTQGEYAAPLAASEADIRAAQVAGQDARNAMLAHYSQDMPQGSSYGDEMAIPDVPANAVPSEGSDLYPFSGTEPTPASAGMAGPYPAA
jgi:hypothetical protein